MLVRVSLPIGLLAAGCIAYSILSSETEQTKDPATAEQTLQTKVVELRVGDYPVVIHTHGIVRPHNEVTLSALVSGQITYISPAFESGSYFFKGDVLVELDSQDYITALAVAESRQLGAMAAQKLATQNHEQIMKLLPKNVITEAEVNQSSAAKLQARAEFDSATAQVEQARRNLERTKILAPFDGRVRQKAVGLGESVGLGTSLGVVFSVEYAEIRLPIAGRELQYLDLPELAGDKPVEVELRDAISEASENVWKAKIVRTEGTLDQNSLELFAIARVDDPFGLKSKLPPLRIGQPVKGAIVGKVLTNVVALPRLAVRRLDQVFLVDRTKLTLTAKTIVPIWSDEKYIIIEDPSIQDGMLLSTSHLVYAPNGAKVEIIKDIEPTSVATKRVATSEAKPVAN